MPVAGKLLVRVPDGEADERTVGEIGRGEWVGEYAMLTGEPRSADVSALEATHLLCLAQEDFYTLLRERPQISRAINRVICQRLRSR